jgi:two-component system sensor histidine kinase KdpD
MSELTANVLDMARFETGRGATQPAMAPLRRSVWSRSRPVHMRLEGRHVDVDLSKSPPLVWLDTVLIGQVLTNLLDNAVKYTPARSPIELSAAVVPDGVEVAVSDHGVGLLPGQEQRVFEKFYRAHPEGATGGAGLGLAICRAIVEAHRGHIRADNRSGGGVRFSFVLPQPSQPVGPCRKSKRRIAMSDPHPIVVLIEDEPQIRRLLRTVLPAQGIELFRSGKRIEGTRRSRHATAGCGDSRPRVAGHRRRRSGETTA